MERPPTIIEIQDALAEMRLPQEQALAALYLRRDLFLEKYRDTPAEGTPRFKEKANAYRQQIRERQKAVEAFPKIVYGTLILAEPGTDALHVLVLVPTQYVELPPFTIRGWSIQLVTGSLRLQRSRTGDILPQGLVVSVNGSPILSPARRKKALDSRLNFPVNVREQRKLERERRRQDYERFLKERREREQVRIDQIESERLAKERLESEEREKWLAEKREKQIALQEEAVQRNHKELARWEESRKQQEARQEERVALALPPPPERPEPKTPFSIQLGVLASTFAVGCVIGYLTMRPWFSLVGLFCMGIAGLVLRLGKAVGVRR